jgi:hypothetical protein
VDSAAAVRHCWRLAQGLPARPGQATRGQAQGQGFAGRSVHKVVPQFQSPPRPPVGVGRGHECGGVRVEPQRPVAACATWRASGIAARSLMAMLELGTSHNRWYVERKFCGLCATKMDDLLARRLSVEFRAGGTDVCRSIDHLKHSIGVETEILHPILQQTLKEICA